jgi:hypothetical protein
MLDGRAESKALTVDPSDEDVSIVRPFFVARGRADERYQLDTATQVVVKVPQPPAPHLEWTPEHREIVNMCGAPVAVSEIAAVLEQPLGVVRVLIADLLDNALVTTYSPTAFISEELLTKVLHGLIHNL